MELDAIAKNEQIARFLAMAQVRVRRNYAKVQYGGGQGAAQGSAFGGMTATGQVQRERTSETGIADATTTKAGQTWLGKRLATLTAADLYQIPYLYVYVPAVRRERGKIRLGTALTYQIGYYYVYVPAVCVCASEQALTYQIGYYYVLVPAYSTHTNRRMMSTD